MSESDSVLHGDVLDSITKRISTVDLLSSRHVSSTWRQSVASSLPLRLSKPWLLLQLLPRGAHAGYDPYSRAWVPLLPLQSPPATCHPSPNISRVDPVVATVGGTHVVVAGGTWEFEDASPASVEVLDLSSLKWAPQEPIPGPLETSATWLSVATSATEMHVLSKESGLLSSFTPSTGKWTPPRDIRPDSGIGLSAIAYTGIRLLFAGLTGGARLRMWEVGRAGGGPISEMPAEMVGRLVGPETEMGRMTTLGFLAVGAFSYFYNPTNFTEGFSYDLEERRWESIGMPEALKEDPTAKIVFQCSTLSVDHLAKLFRSTR